MQRSPVRRQTAARVVLNVRRLKRLSSGVIVSRYWPCHASAGDGTRTAWLAGYGWLLVSTSPIRVKVTVRSVSHTSATARARYWPASVPSGRGCSVMTVQYSAGNLQPSKPDTPGGGDVAEAALTACHCSPILSNTN